MPGNDRQPEQRVPAAEEEQRREARDRDHVQVLGDEEQPEAQARVLGVEPADEFGLGLDQIERRAIGLGDRGDDVDDEADELRHDEPPACPARGRCPRATSCPRGSARR